MHLPLSNDCCAHSYECCHALSPLLHEERRYEQHVIEGFREWLRERFGSAEAVNKAFGLYHWSYAAVTRNDFGDGHAWYIGRLMDKAELSKYVAMACEEAGIKVPQLKHPVVIREACNERGTNLHFIFNYSSEPAEIPSPYSGTDILTGEALCEGSRINVPDWGVRIIR